VTPPFFSVVIPTYGRPEALASCLRALTRTKFPRKEFEVIVVDDKNEADTQRIVGRFDNELSIVLKRQNHAGPAAARNAGAALARGGHLAFTDDDCLPSSDWLGSLAKRLRIHPACGVGGRTVNAIPDSACSTASAILADFLYSYFNPDPDEARLLFTSNLTVPRRPFLEMGGFKIDFPFAGGEDREFCHRWRFLGHRLAYAPEAVVLHRHRLKTASFLRQHFTYGRGAYHFHKTVAGYDSRPIRVEPPSFYLKLMASAVGGRNAPGRHDFRKKQPALALTFLLGLSQAANAAGYLREMVKPSKSRRPRA